MGRQPFRGSVAVAAGLLSATELRTSKWRRIFTDVYVDARVKDSRLLRIQAAALLIANDAIITGRSAAFLWGVKMGSIEDPIEVLSPTRARPSGLVIHTGSISPDEIVTRFGVPIPSLPHTAWEIARHLPTLDAVPWIDYLARLRRIETTELLAHAAGHRGEWGCRTATATLRLCDRRAESPPESIIRVSLALGGVPAPVPQLEIFHRGEFLARVDFGWAEIKLALEYDGQWHADRNQLTRDRIRVRNLNAAGWYVFPITRDDLRDLNRLVETIRRLITIRSRLL